MRRLFSLLALCVALLFGTAPAFAADVAHGAQVFSANCVACHMGGGNVVNAERTLKAEALEAYLANYSAGHEAAIAYQDRKSTRLNSSHVSESRMPSSA
mgnify:CR=1 FL=1